MPRKRQLAAGLSVILLTGCPQLSDDSFESALPMANLHTDPDAGGAPGAGASAGTGGAAGSSTGGAAGASAGAGGDGSAVGGAGVEPGSGGTSSGAAPVVSSVVPANGARGVLPDAELVLTFSAPMDTRSVEAAYVSSELPAAQASFTWSEGDTVLNIRPNSPLQVNGGADPSTVIPASYAIDLGSSGTDKAGHAMVPEHVNFTVVRAITETRNAVQDRDLTGNWRSDGAYGSTFCERVDTTVCVGDGAGVYQGYVTFPLDSLPSDLVSISAAELGSTVQQIVGDPFAALGTLRLEQVEFTLIGPEALAAPALSSPKSLSTSAAAAGRMSADVLTEVRAGWVARARSQFRWFFDVGTNSDAVADQLICDWASVQLTLTYWRP